MHKNLNRLRVATFWRWQPLETLLLGSRLVICTKKCFLGNIFDFGDVNLLVAALFLPHSKRAWLVNVISFREQEETLPTHHKLILAKAAPYNLSKALFSTVCLSHYVRGQESFGSGYSAVVGNWSTPMFAENRSCTYSKYFTFWYLPLKLAGLVYPYLLVGTFEQGSLQVSQIIRPLWKRCVRLNHHWVIVDKNTLNIIFFRFRFIFSMYFMFDFTLVWLLAVTKSPTCKLQSQLLRSTTGQ